MMMNLSPLEIAYCIAVMLIGFSLHGGTGFGGAIGMPLLALVLPVKVIAPAWTLIGLLSSAAILRTDLRFVDKERVLGFLPGCAAGVAAGALLFRQLDASQLAHALGVFVILYGLHGLWREYRPPARRAAMPRVILPAIGSFLSGAVGTLFGGMASVFVAMYLDASRVGKTHFRATIFAMVFALSIVRACAYVAVGEMTTDSLVLCASALPFMGLGLVVGNRFHAGISERAFQRSVSYALLLCGIPLLAR